MIYLDVEQGGSEWLAARRGIPTASCFGKIFSAKTMKPLQNEYPFVLLTEWAVGANLDEQVTEWMQRGHDVEERAIAYVSFQHGAVTRPGIYLRDDRMVGASPDLQNEADTFWELKVPAAKTHLQYLLDQEPTKYMPQMMGQMWIGGRRRVRFMSYHDKLPPVDLLFEWDEAFCRAMIQHVEDFVGLIQKGRQRLSELGVVPEAQPPLDEKLIRVVKDVLA